MTPTANNPADLHQHGVDAAAAVILDRACEDNRASSRALDDLTPETQARYRLFAAQVVLAHLNAAGDGVHAAAAVILDHDYEDNRATSRALEDMTPQTQARYQLFAGQVIAAYLTASDRLTPH